VGGAGETSLAKQFSTARQRAHVNDGSPACQGFWANLESLIEFARNCASRTGDDLVDQISEPFDGMRIRTKNIESQQCKAKQNAVNLDQQEY
jgi:hypothetical protein